MSNIFPIWFPIVLYCTSVIVYEIKHHLCQSYASPRSQDSPPDIFCFLRPFFCFSFYSFPSLSGLALFVCLCVDDLLLTIVFSSRSSTSSSASFIKSQLSRLLSAFLRTGGDSLLMPSSSATYSHFLRRSMRKNSKDCSMRGGTKLDILPIYGFSWMIFLILVQVMESVQWGSGAKTFWAFVLYPPWMDEWFIEFEQYQQISKGLNYLQKYKLALFQHMATSHRLMENHKNYPFIHRLAALQADFFLSLSDFCIEQLKHKIQHKQSIYKQTQPTQQQQQQIDKQESDEPQQQTEQVKHQNKKSRKKAKIQKPLFTIYKPKAPTTSYLLYLHDNKSQISSKYNLSNISEITKAASQEWKKLPEEEKEQYCKKSQELKAKYHSDMEVYREKYAQEIKQYKKKRQLSKPKAKKKQQSASRPIEQLIQSDKQAHAKKAVELDSSLNNEGQDSLQL